jgi:hypothetical protein
MIQMLIGRELDVGCMEFCVVYSQLFYKSKKSLFLRHEWESYALNSKPWSPLEAKDEVWQLQVSSQVVIFSQSFRE